MKNKLLKCLTIGIGTLALAVPLAISLPKMVNVPNNDSASEANVDLGPAPSFETPKPVSLNSPKFVTEDSEETVVVNKVVLHYHNDDNEVQSKRFYTWTTGVDGIERKPDKATATDMEITLDFNVLTEYKNMPSIFFIIKKVGTWDKQSEDTELVFADHTDAIVDGVLTIWCIPGEGSSIEMYATEEETKLPKVTTAKFTDYKTIHCTCTIDDKGKAWAPTSYKLYAFDKSYLSMPQAAQLSNKELYLFKHGNLGEGNNEFDIKFNYYAKLNVQYMLETVFPGFENKPARKIVVSCENLYEDARFEQYFTYSGDDLGVTYTPSQTTFKVWSPVSAYVTVNLYDRGDPVALNIEGGSDACQSFSMYYTAGGVWELTITGDLKGKFYTYSLTHSAGTVEAMDPYAKACGVNGIRGFIYDKNSSEANPDDWDSVPLRWDGVDGYDIRTPQDLSVYEVHIRDLTMDDTWVSNKGNKRGTYNAFSEAGTKYKLPGSASGPEVTTGYDHIKDLGVKAIQLIPVFDNDNDEREEKMKFNWGYNPLNYNCVEGGYSSDPLDPLARIKEYKNLVKAYSENGNHTRVIMDVVYNHVSSASASCFTKIMPKYYFRYDENWAYYDGSGCSNEVKTDSTMMRKFIVDSLCWWATEYKIKGFRFDLMGLIDSWTLRAAKEALYEIDPDIVIYGEGWTSGGYHGKTEWSGDQLINGGSETSLVYQQLYASESSHGQVGAFNDAGRDALRGGNDGGWGASSSYPTWGFISQGTSDVGDKSKRVAGMMMGANGYHWGSDATYDSPKGVNPNQTINYASCHDNYTVWDQLRYTLATGYTQDGKMIPTGDASTQDLIYATLAVHGSVMFSNGVAFIQGGEELYRTKSYEYCTKEEFDKVIKGGDDAIVRPYPRYEHYVEGGVYATGDVYFGGNINDLNNQNIISHNSYRAPDSLNSFKWDRKIKIGSYDTSGFNQLWCDMIKARNDIAHASYSEIYEQKDTSKFNVWGEGNGSSVIAEWALLSSDNTKGYGIIFAGRPGSSFTWGGMSIVSVVFKNRPDITNSGTENYLPPYGFVVYKLNK